MGLPLCLFNFAHLISSDYFLTVPGVGGKQPLSPECFPVTAAFSGEGAINTWQGLLPAPSSRLLTQAPEKLGLLKGVQERDALPCVFGGQGRAGHGPGLFVPCSSQQPSLASEPQMAPACGWSPSKEVGWYRVSAGSHSPGALVLGMAQRQEGARLPRTALSGLSVAGRPAASWPCSLRGLRHTLA